MDPHVNIKDPYGPHVGILGLYYPMCHTWVLYLVIELYGFLQKPKIENEDTGLALDIGMKEAYLYLIWASFQDTDYHTYSILFLSWYLSLGSAEHIS